MASSDGFVHLHVHSEYSLLDGGCRIKDLLTAAKAHGMPALALTDHGNLFGAIHFYKEAKEAGIKPILGYEAYLTPGSRHDRTGGQTRDGLFHLTLLAKNAEGYRSLMQIASRAYLEGFYYKPRVDRELLQENSSDLICLSGCLQSEMSQLVLQDELKKAETVAEELCQIFGRENFYIEIQDNGMAEQKQCLKGLCKVAKKLSLPLVATNDIHYLAQDDALAHEVLLCINTRKTLDDEDRMSFSTDEFYFKSPAEMAERFRAQPESVRNTLEIAEKCNVELALGDYHYPDYRASDELSNDDYIRHLCEEGIKERYGEPHDKPVDERLDYELEVIRTTGFTSYFLIVWDFVRFAVEHHIPVGPGRGSGAGSIVAYALGITDVDPLKYDLLFERFLNADRISPPDFDIDFCEERRDEVIEYVRQKYGAANVSNIITFGTMKAKGSIRDVGRVMDIPLDKVNDLAKKIPNVLNITLTEALEQHPELRQSYNTDPKVKQLFDIAMKVEGLARHASMHPAGVVIADKSITEYAPLYKSGDDMMTQFEHGTVVDDLGLLKADFLSLRTLTIIDKALKLIESTTGKKIDIRSIPLDDKRVYELLSTAESKGIFQLESGGMKDLLRRMRPDTFEDVIALIALYRPGPLGSGMVDTYVNCKHDLETPSYLHPSLEPILASTNGVILYQEQVMRIANVMAQFTLNEADNLRKAMGKKKPEIMAKFKQQFVDGSVANGVEAPIATQVFELMEYFAGYGFNKSHSTAYALVAYHTAWLKVHYPVEYLAALMTCEEENTDKIVDYMEECRRLEIDVMPPCINKSFAQFTVDGDKLRFGLGAVKGVGEKAVEAVIAARKEGGPFESLLDFCERADLRTVNKAVAESLIKCGAYDCLGAKRAQLMLALDAAMEAGAVAQRDRENGQMSLFEALAGQESEAAPPAPPLPNVPEWEEAELLANEKATLGFFVSAHPLNKHEKLIKRLRTPTVTKVKTELEGRTEVSIVAILTNIEHGITKSGKRKVDAVIEDLSGTIAGVIFGDEEVERLRPQLVADTPLLVQGELSLSRRDPEIRIRELGSLDKAHEKLTSSVTIRFDGEHLVDDNLDRLREILLANNGKCPVFLDMTTHGNGRALVKVDRDYYVKPSLAFRMQAEQLLGHGSVVFKADGSAKNGNGGRRSRGSRYKRAYQQS